VLGAVGSSDKSWVMDPARNKSVYRSGAHVSAVVLVGGRVADTWRYDRKAKGLAVTVTPFEHFRESLARRVRTRASAIAAFMGMKLISVDG
jgi:hypothetical protein